MYGLVLEGGGARGAFQLGAWKALKELGIEIGGIAGTSVGALNGAIIAQDDFARAYELWYNMKHSKVMNIDDQIIEKLKRAELDFEDVQYFYNKIKTVFNQQGIDISPLVSLLTENIDEEKIRKSGKDFAIVTISLTDFKPLELYIEDIPAGQLVNYLIASSSLPVFKQQRIDGKIYLDGGFYNNLPINLLTARGYKEIIAVKLIKYNSIFNSVQQDVNIKYITPSERLGGILDFSQERVRRNIKLGYLDTLKQFNKLKGMKYYIQTNNGNNKLIIDYLTNLDQTTIEKVGKVLGVQGAPTQKMLFDYILPKLAELLGLKRNASYLDITTALLEHAARQNNIDRLNVYSIRELVEAILDKHNFASGKNTNIPEILRHSDLVLRTMKEEVLNDVIEIVLSSTKKDRKNKG